jgi:hypothetical protein
MICDATGRRPRPRRVYGASPIKRNRRSKAGIERICAAMHDALAEENPMTVRQVFYRLVSTGVIAKTEKEYKSTVCRLLAIMRRNGEIPFGWIADATRWMRKPRTYSSLSSMLDQTARTYRRALWNDQDAYVEVWLEKDALAGVLIDVTAKWDVPLVVTRGYPSLSYLYDAAEALSAQVKPCFLYYLGDHDPSGVDIPRKVESDLRKFAPNAELAFERIAVTMEQVEQWDLQTRPTKTSDSRSKGFEGDSVEVDAIPPAELRNLVRACIEQHIDSKALRRTQTVEEAERATLQSVLENLRANR